jgi:hypothetical protein
VRERQTPSSPPDMLHRAQTDYDRALEELSRRGVNYLPATSSDERLRLRGRSGVPAGCAPPLSRWMVYSDLLPTNCRLMNELHMD